MRGRGLRSAVLAAALALMLAAQAQAQQGRTMTLQSVTIDDQNGAAKPPEWVFQRDEATRTIPAGRATFRFALPVDVAPQGTPFTITLDTTGTNYAPTMSVSGETVRPAGSLDVSNYAQSPAPVTLPTASNTGTLDPTLAPATATTTRVLVGFDFGSGPKYTYTYALSAAAPPPPPPPPPKPPPKVTAANATNATVTPAIALVFPPTKQCVSRRNFRIRLVRPPKVSYLAASVKVNGRQVPVVAADERYRTIRGRALLRRRLTARVDLRGLPKGTFRVQIIAVTTSLRRITGTRTYRTCAGKGTGSKPPV